MGCGRGRVGGREGGSLRALGPEGEALAPEGVGAFRMRYAVRGWGFPEAAMR